MLQVNNTTQDERICTFTDMQRGKLHYELLDIIRLIGIQEPPDDKDMQAIVLLCVRFFPNLKINDIKTAFLENSAGALQKKIEPFYNSFDWNFVGSVLNMYVKTHREEKLSKPVMPVSHQIENLVPKEVEWKRNYALLLNIIRKENRIPIEGFPWSDIWKVLTLKKRVQNIDPELKNQIKEKVTIKLNVEAQKRCERMDAIIGNAVMADALNNFEYHCKKEYCIQYFSKYIKPIKK